tara:strand:+ start:52 stop:1878 length:1827 start_codon:yes stop_codon:yes gene_type:complete
MSFQIPRYTARVQRTNEMPGKRFNVRKNAEPFVRAELAKGEVAASLFDTAGEFAIQRRDMIATSEYNEAAVSIEEGMRQAMSDFSNDGDVRNILDQKNKWGQRMKKLRSDVLSNVQSPSMRKKVLHQFDLLEVQNRFSLKSVIDKKIIALDQLGVKSRFESARLDLGKLDVQNTTYINKFIDLAKDYAPGIANGRYNQEAINQSVLTLKTDVAKDVVSLYVGQDAERAFALMLGLEQIGKEVPEGEEIFLETGGDYTMFALSQIPAEEAQDIIMEAFNDAKAFTTFKNQLDAKLEADFKLVSSSLKNSYTRFTNLFDPNEMLSEEDMLDIDLRIPEIEEYFKTSDVMSAATARKFVTEHLYSIGEVDEAFQNAIDKDNDELLKPKGKSAIETDEEVFKDLLDAHVAGTLTMNEVKENRSKLSSADYKTFAGFVLENRRRKLEKEKGEQTIAQSRVDKAFDSALRLAKNKYQYDALSSLDANFATSSRAAYFKVSEAMYELLRDSLKQGADPLTIEKINTTLDKAVQDNEQLYFDDVRLNFENYVSTNISAKTLTGLNFTFSQTSNMIEEVDAWFETLSAEQRGNDYIINQTSRVKARLTEFIKSGAFN